MKTIYALMLSLMFSMSALAAEPLDDVVYDTSPKTKTSLMSTQSVAPATIDGKLKRHVALVFLRNTEPPAEGTERWTGGDKSALWVENYFKFHAGHVWDVEVQAFIAYTDCRPAAPQYCQIPVLESLATQDMNGFEPNYYHVIGGAHPSYCGQAGIHSSWGVTYNWGTCGLPTVAHELGHNFGWHHAGTLNVVTGDETEYGDSSSIMGSSHRYNGLLSQNYVQEGLDRTRQNISETTQIIVAPLEINPAGLYDDEVQHFRVSTGVGYPYTLSLRKKEGVPFAPNSAGKGLQIHQVRSMSAYSTARTKLIETLYSSEEPYTLPNGVVIDYLEYDRERARVNVIFPDDLAPEDIKLHSFFPVPETAHITEAHTGAWYDPETNGQGFDIQIKGDRAVVYWYTYDQGDSDRRWYIGVCTISTTCMDSFEIFTTHSGTFDNPLAHSEIPVGEAQLYFTDSLNAVFNFDLEEFGRNTISLKALALGKQSPIDGSWFSPDHSGSGFSTQLYGDLLVMFWYTYGPRAAPVFYGSSPGSTQRWFLMVGKANESGEYEMQVLEFPDGGRWNWFTQPEEIDVGTAKVKLTDGKIQFEYDITAKQLIKAGSYELIQLF